VYRRLGQPHLAIADYQEAIRLNPQADATLFYNLACLLATQKQPDQALAYLQQAIEIEPGLVIENAQVDPDLSTLQADPRFQALILKRSN
jgi:tetratricopeptide (TPR) repeat protein